MQETPTELTAIWQRTHYWRRCAKIGIDHVFSSVFCAGIIGFLIVSSFSIFNMPRMDPQWLVYPCYSVLWGLCVWVCGVGLERLEWGGSTRPWRTFVGVTIGSLIGLALVVFRVPSHLAGRLWLLSTGSVMFPNHGFINIPGLILIGIFVEMFAVPILGLVGYWIARGRTAPSSRAALQPL